MGKKQQLIEILLDEIETLEKENTYIKELLAFAEAASEDQLNRVTADLRKEQERTQLAANIGLNYLDGLLDIQTVILWIIEENKRLVQ